MPNDESLDPPEDRPRILSELGSHSSGLAITRAVNRCQRLPDGDGLADTTDGALDDVREVVSLPIAYGLPRDERLGLPYVVPELDGDPIYEHERLPAVERSDLLPESLAVRSLDGLDASPSDLPSRETGLLFVIGPSTGPTST